MSINWFLKSRIIAIFVVFALGSAFAQEWTPQKEQKLEKKSEYSPYVDQHIPQRVYFGDTPHHSSYSFDSGMFGNTLGPEESFRFDSQQDMLTFIGPTFVPQTDVLSV